MICWPALMICGASREPAWTVASPWIIEKTLMFSPAVITDWRPRIEAEASGVSNTILLPATSLLVETPTTP